jgi:TRAP-type C4-dicarboxylate transport system permease small subunit
LNPILVSTMALFALAGGYLGWRRWTRKIYRRTYSEFDVPEGMTRREYDRALRRQGKRWRLVATFAYAVAGALGGVLLLVLLVRR